MRAYTPISRYKSKPITQTDFTKVLLEEIRAKLDHLVETQTIPRIQYLTKRIERPNHQDIFIYFKDSAVEDSTALQTKLQDLLEGYNREPGTLTGMVKIKVKVSQSS